MHNESVIMIFSVPTDLYRAKQSDTWDRKVEKS